jgi:DNA relaxase NicK
MRVTQDALLARVERVASTLSRRRVWLQKQVSKTLALLDKAIGADQFEAMLAELISIGRDKLRCRDNILIHEYLSCE